MMDESRSHRKNSSHHRSKKKSIERILSGSVFKILGIIFLLIGLYYAFSSLETLNLLKEAAVNFFTQPDEKSIKTLGVAGVAGGFVTLLLHFLPAALILGIVPFFTIKFSSITYPLTLIASTSLFVIQVLIVVYYPLGNNSNSLYGNIFTAGVFLFVFVFLLLTNAIFHKKTLLLLLTIIYFYCSLALFKSTVTDFSWQLEYIVPFILIFSLAVAWTARKMQQPVLNLVNFFFAIGLFGIFWLRRLVVGSNPELLIEFFVYGSLIYLVFYAITIYAALAKEKHFNHWMQGVMAGLNLFFYCGTTSLVIIRYYSFDYLWILVLSLFLFNLAGWYLMEKYKLTVWKMPHHMVVLLLAALILPLLIRRDLFLLFTAVLSVLFILYAGYSGYRYYVRLSIVAAWIMFFVYLVRWVITYLPALILEKTIPENGLLLQGVLSGIVVVTALAINKRILQNREQSLHRKRFHESKNLRWLHGILLFTLFLAISWTGIVLICYLTGSMSYVSMSWFIPGSIYFIVLINLHSDTESYFKKPILYIAFTFALLYPLLVQLPLIGFRETLGESGFFTHEGNLLHFIALVLLLLLSASCLPRIFRMFQDNLPVRHGLQLLVIIYLLFLLISEYDNLSVILTAGQKSASTPVLAENNILELNRHLPWSVIIGLSSILILVWATIRHHRFIKISAFVIFILAIIKIFVYDFPVLNATSRTIIFVVLGLFLIAISFWYPRLLKTVSRSRQFTNHHSSKRAVLNPSEKAPSTREEPGE